MLRHQSRGGGGVGVFPEALSVDFNTFVGKTAPAFPDMASSQDKKLALDKRTHPHKPFRSRTCPWDGCVEDDVLPAVGEKMDG